MTTPTAQRVIDGAHQYVLLDLNDAEDTDGQTFLAALCRAIVTSSRVDALLIAGNRLHTDTARSDALGLIAGDQLIRDALRVRLTREEGDALAGALEDAAWPAHDCCKPSCERLVDDEIDADRCPLHVDADEGMTA